MRQAIFAIWFTCFVGVSAVEPQTAGQALATGLVAGGVAFYVTRRIDRPAELVATRGDGEDVVAPLSADEKRQLLSTHLTSRLLAEDPEICALADELLERLAKHPSAEGLREDLSRLGSRALGEAAASDPGAERRARGGPGAGQQRLFRHPAHADDDSDDNMDEDDGESREDEESREQHAYEDEDGNVPQPGPETEDVEMRDGGEEIDVGKRLRIKLDPSGPWISGTVVDFGHGEPDMLDVCLDNDVCGSYILEEHEIEWMADDIGRRLRVWAERADAVFEDEETWYSGTVFEYADGLHGVEWDLDDATWLDLANWKHEFLEDKERVNRGTKRTSGKQRSKSPRELQIERDRKQETKRKVLRIGSGSIRTLDDDGWPLAAFEQNDVFSFTRRFPSREAADAAKAEWEVEERDKKSSPYLDYLGKCMCEQRTSKLWPLVERSHGHLILNKVQGLSGKLVRCYPEKFKMADGGGWFGMTRDELAVEGFNMDHAESWFTHDDGFPALSLRFRSYIPAKVNRLIRGVEFFGPEGLYDWAEFYTSKDPNYIQQRLSWAKSHNYRAPLWFIHPEFKMAYEFCMPKSVSQPRPEPTNMTYAPSQAEVPTRLWEIRRPINLDGDLRGLSPPVRARRWHIQGRLHAHASRSGLRAKLDEAPNWPGRREVSADIGLLSTDRVRTILWKQKEY
mmetsp:Transcript_36297/g.122905  ORF Transcript_36297/g.122905 Transcript_36297/m.122905 type:complete len:682 (-) Transcript_36297:367-2412(-)